MTDEELNFIGVLCNVATPGPWKYVDLNDQYLAIVRQDSDGGVDDFDYASDWTDLLVDENRYADAAFMANARSDLPALIAEVRRLREENDRLRAALPTRVATARELDIVLEDNQRLREREAEQSQWIQCCNVESEALQSWVDEYRARLAAALRIANARLAAKDSSGEYRGG